ncbi:MAG: OmpA family protein [Acidobacteriota bacterium]
MKTSSQVRISRLTSLSLLALFALFATACHKKAPLPPPPPPPTSNTNPGPGEPSSGRPVVAEFSAEPSSIERGQSAQLRWSVTGATEVSINRGIGTIPATGSRGVTPVETTSWTLTANGPGGTTTANATISVTAPAPAVIAPPPSNTGNKGTVESRLQSDLQDILFDYDSNNLRDDSRAILQADAEALKRIFADFPGATIYVEGHCDERGSAEYNLGLGDRRASAAREFLAQQGVSPDRLKTISYGKERPVCTEATEGCYQRNRRAHFASGQ